MSIIAAGTSTGQALVNTGNTDGTLVLQTNGSTTALTLGTDQSATFAAGATFSGAISVTGDSSITGEFIATSLNETYVALSGTTPTVDCEAGNVFALSTTGNTTFTFSNPPTSGTGYGFILKLTAGGTHTISWPASVDWAAATAPDAPASGETDVLGFLTYDGGTTWYGFLAGDAMG